MPADRKSIEVGRGHVTLSTDKSPLERGLAAAAARVQAFGATIAQLGAGIAVAGASMATGLAASVFHFAHVGDAMNDMSERTGLAVEALSELAYAASLSGASAEDLESGIRI